MPHYKQALGGHEQVDISCKFRSIYQIICPCSPISSILGGNIGEKVLNRQNRTDIDWPVTRADKILNWFEARSQISSLSLYCHLSMQVRNAGSIKSSITEWYMKMTKLGFLITFISSCIYTSSVCGLCIAMWLCATVCFQRDIPGTLYALPMTFTSSD